MKAEIYAAAAFKTHCFAIFDRLARREIDQVTITVRGRAVAVLTPPPPTTEEVDGLYGFMRGSVCVLRDRDLIAPAFDESQRVDAVRSHE